MNKLFLSFCSFCVCIMMYFFASIIPIYAIAVPPRPIPTPTPYYESTAVFTTAIGNPVATAGAETDFVSEIQGQGRILTTVGKDQNSFVQTIQSRGTGLLSNTPNSANYLQKIYTVSTKNNINPVLLLCIWGVEASFEINGTEFGATPSESGFDNQLQTAVDTLNQSMIDFTSNDTAYTTWRAAHPSCKYTDPFIYAYEVYTPDCSANLGNANARNNFTIFYKIFTNQ